MNQLIKAATLRSSNEVPTASMNEVVMRKEELLNVLIENKAKHDAIYDAAVAGYWETAQEKLQEKRRQLSLALEEFGQDVETQFKRLENKVEKKEILPYSIQVRGLQWATNLDLIFPENHTKDYERAIRMMQASIYNEVRLSEQEFDSYVLNNWEWKEKFLASNSYYVDNIRGKKGVLGLAGPAGPIGSGHNEIYATARTAALNTLQLSGCASF